jgi:hypothetical protein
MDDNNNDNTEFYKAIDSLKELILTKFAELEKRLNLTQKNIDLKIQTINSKDAEQDTKIKSLEEKITSNRETAAKDKLSTWEGIKDTFVRWFIPFLFMALIFFISHGTIKL